MARVELLPIRQCEERSFTESIRSAVPERKPNLIYLLQYRLLKAVALVLTCVIALEALVFHFALYALVALVAGGLILQFVRWLW